VIEGGRRGDSGPVVVDGAMRRWGHFLGHERPTLEQDEEVMVTPIRIRV
jgi:hypothetical protein